MAESQAAHRQRIEDRVVAGRLAAERQGQSFAFILALVAIIAGVGLIAFDKDTGGLVTIIGALASVVAIFVYGRHKEAEERGKKRNDFASPRLPLPYDDTAPESAPDSTKQP